MLVYLRLKFCRFQFSYVTSSMLQDMEMNCSILVSWGSICVAVHFVERRAIFFPDVTSFGEAMSIWAVMHWPLYVVGSTSVQVHARKHNHVIKFQNAELACYSWCSTLFLVIVVVFGSQLLSLCCLQVRLTCNYLWLLISGSLF